MSVRITISEQHVDGIQDVCVHTHTHARTHSQPLGFREKTELYQELYKNNSRCFGK